VSVKDDDTGTGSARPHAWHIDEREYARHEERRGRRHAFESLTATRTALVVIDMVPFFVRELPSARAVVPHVNQLARSLRSAGGTAVWVLPGPSPHLVVGEEFYGPEVARTYGEAGGTGTPRQRLWHELDVQDDDLLVEKSAPSAFFPGRSPLPGLLQERGVDTVLITGAVTNVCCESSVRDASTLGYRTIMVADANAAGRDQEHNATLHTVYRSFGDVRPTREVLELIHAGTRPAGEDDGTADVSPS
jgi:nicotinamidase-related amidase